MRIRKGDSVIVVTGDDASATPRRVLQLLDGGRKLVVEGVNRVYKHVRRGHPKSPQGGRLQLEMPIDASNVLVQCPACGKGTRVGLRYAAEGRKERFCKKCQATLSTVGGAERKAYAGKAQ